MSEDVHYQGKIKLLADEDLENVARRMLYELGNNDIPDYYDDPLEYLRDEYYDQYIVTDDAIYEIVEKKEVCPYSGFFEASENDDGTIYFNVKYYNGGCGFEEAIEEALSDMEKRK